MRDDFQPLLKFYLFVRKGLVLTHDIVCLWRLEDNIRELVFSFPTVDPRDQTQDVRIGGKHLHPRNHPWTLLWK